MRLAQIAVIGRSRELGCAGGLIWDLPEDLKFFRRETQGHPVVMGRRTFESLPGVLPGRTNIVLSSKEQPYPANVQQYRSFEDFLQEWKDYEGTVYVIGGGPLYKQSLPFCDELVLTLADADAPEADTWYPEYDPNDYVATLIDQRVENGIPYRHVRFVKK